MKKIKEKMLSLSEWQHACVTQVKTFHEGKYPAGEPGTFHPADWSRIEFVTQLLESLLAEVDKAEAVRILDVGVGGGQFINVLQATGMFSEVHGVDVTWHSKLLIRDDSVRLHKMSVESLEFSNNAFDFVTCMEVLEHVEDEIFEKGLAELRRVARRALVFSVPFNEPEPIPSYHLRRFEEADLRRLFPTAEVTLLRKPNYAVCPWALMLERRPNPGGWNRLAKARDVIRNALGAIRRSLERSGPRIEDS